MTGTVPVPEFGTPSQDARERPGAYGLLLDGSGGVAVCRSAARRLYLPGGGAEAGESLADALAREVREEIGLVVEVGRRVAVGVQQVVTRTEGAFRKVEHFFRVEALDGRPATGPQDHEMTWLTLEEARRRLHEDCQRWAVAQAMP